MKPPEELEEDNKSYARVLARNVVANTYRMLIGEEIEMTSELLEAVVELVHPLVDELADKIISAAEDEVLLDFAIPQDERHKIVREKIMVFVEDYTGKMIPMIHNFAKLTGPSIIANNKFVN